MVQATDPRSLPECDHLAALKEILTSNGYRNLKLLPTGEMAGVLNMLFTTGLCVGLDECGYRTRFCFESTDEADAALAAWDGKGFPPGWWIKQKPEDVENPLHVFAQQQGDRTVSPPGKD